MGGDAVGRIRDAFLAAGYTTDGVLDLLGASAHAALARDETVPARRRTTGGSPLETLVRLFLLQLDVPEEQAAAALPLSSAVAVGLLTRSGRSVRAAVDVRPYGQAAGSPAPPWWVVSDLGTGVDGATRPLPADYVLGVGGASTTLAQLVPRDPVVRALDLGTGSGVQALHLQAHAAEVVATDLSARALRLARLTAGLSDVPVDLRLGDLYGPVAGERFDLVVSNPPFVVTPPSEGEDRYTYRDAGLPGDEVCRRLVAGAPEVLAEGGTLVMLANWLHLPGRPWHERVAAWLPAEVDAWVVQRDLEDPAAYVSTWLRDSGETGSPRYVEAYDSWLSALERDGVEAVGFGWIVLRRTGRAGARHLEEWTTPFEQPLGAVVKPTLDRIAWLAGHDEQALLGARLVVAADVVQEQIGQPGEENLEQIVLRQRHGLRRAHRVGTATAATVGACDGTLTLGAILDAVATVLARGPEAVRREVLADVAPLLRAGVISPAAEPRRNG